MAVFFGRINNLRGFLLIAAIVLWAGYGVKNAFSQSSLEYTALQGQVQGTMQKTAGQAGPSAPAVQPDSKAQEEAPAEAAREDARNFLAAFGPKQIVVLLAMLALLWFLMHK